MKIFLLLLAILACTIAAIVGFGAFHPASWTGGLFPLGVACGFASMLVKD